MNEHMMIDETIAIASAYEAMVNEAVSKEDKRIKYFTFDGKEYKLEKTKNLPNDKQKSWTSRSISGDSINITIFPQQWDGIMEILNGEIDEYHFTDQSEIKWKIVKRSTILRFESLGENAKKVEVPINVIKTF